MLGAALAGLETLDEEHARVYFQVVWNGLREPMRRALEALVMERQVDGAGWEVPPFMQRLMEQSERKGELKGKLEGKVEGKLEGKLEGKVDDLLRFAARLGIALSEADRARVLGCTDLATIDRWLDNVLSAKSSAELLT